MPNLEVRMPNFIEFEGRTVEKAIEKACDKMNLPVEEIKHDVLSHGSTGIFGLVGIKKAKIRVLVPENKKNDYISDNKKNTSKESRNKTAKEKALKLVDKTFGEIKEFDNNSKLNNEQSISEGEEAIKKIISYITEGSNIDTIKLKNGLKFNITGGDSALLIGKRGQTLEAIQYVVEKIANKKRTERIKIIVDVEGYLESRKDNLEKLAKRLAEKANKVGKPMTIEQMNSHDRRIVHLLLKKNNNVRTQSIGEGHYRKLMIFPKKRKVNLKKKRKA
jgi:spoIIIJ-associated protein